jgi:hypothetical protein
MQSWARMEMKMGTVVGRSWVTKDNAVASGTRMMGQTHKRGLTQGRVRAREGRPGSRERQVEQTLARGWVLRPDAARETEAVSKLMAGTGGEARATRGGRWKGETLGNW